MPRLKLHQIVLALAVSAALTACGEKTAQTTETPQAASAASAADATASTAAVSAPQNSANVSDEDKALLERAQATFKPLPDAAEMQKVRPFYRRTGQTRPTTLVRKPPVQRQHRQL